MLAVVIMIKDIETLKTERPDLVELFEKMTREELLKQCYLECLDGLNMESRVALFMGECTHNMSKTNYTIGSLKSLINENKEREIDGFCYDLIDDYRADEILIEIKKRAIK